MVSESAHSRLGPECIALWPSRSAPSQPAQPLIEPATLLGLRPPRQARRFDLNHPAARPSLTLPVAHPKNGTVMSPVVRSCPSQARLAAVTHRLLLSPVLLSS
jgi:hypothetical protein